MTHTWRTVNLVEVKSVVGFVFRGPGLAGVAGLDDLRGPALRHGRLGSFEAVGKDGINREPVAIVVLMEVLPVATCCRKGFLVVSIEHTAAITQRAAPLTNAGVLERAGSGPVCVFLFFFFHPPFF